MIATVRHMLHHMQEIETISHNFAARQTSRAAESGPFQGATALEVMVLRFRCWAACISLHNGAHNEAAHRSDLVGISHVVFLRSGVDYGFRCQVLEMMSGLQIKIVAEDEGATKVYDRGEGIQTASPLPFWCCSESHNMRKERRRLKQRPPRECGQSASNEHPQG